MKTKLIIEIESPDSEKIIVIPEEGTDETNYTKEELKKFRDEYSKELHNFLVYRISDYLNKDGGITEDLISDSDYSVNGWDCLEDYGIKITVEEKKNENCRL